MYSRHKVFLASLLLIFSAAAAHSQSVKRVVVLKIDGLPQYYVDRFVNERDPATGRSMLPWIEEVFYKNGTRIPNFYTRGMSLSGPSWGLLDTGQHLQIKGNVEYDRFTLHPYDYLNFLPYYKDYAQSKKVDMQATEVMDQLKVPLLSDAFAWDKKYTSPQLFLRGNDWNLFAGGFVNMFPNDPGDIIDEWTLGLNFRNMTIDQNVRDIAGKLIKGPEIDYLDYYDTSFDHISHHNNDDASRLVELKQLDRLIGKIWTANIASSRADETAIVLISDHGFNSQEKVMSQGFNLVKLLGSAAGGGHHVITKRRLMLNYSLKGVYPLTPLIRTISKDSYYLKGQSAAYSTALLDFDGNERSSIHLRNSDLNIIHILLQQLQDKKLSPDMRSAVTDTLFGVIAKHSREWQQTIEQMDEELDALHRWIEAQQKIIPTLQPKTNKTQPVRQLAERDRRVAVLTNIAIEQETDYRKYLDTLRNLLNLKRENLNPKTIKIAQLIAPGAMGDPNTIYQLQNYVVGLSDEGLTLTADKRLDIAKSFKHVNYLELFHSQRVINNVQRDVSNRPIDFVALRLPPGRISPWLPKASSVTWLFGGDHSQALILFRMDPDGEKRYQYLPVASLREDEAGKFTLDTAELAPGFPLKFFEDKDLAVTDRAAWLKTRSSGSVNTWALICFQRQMTRTFRRTKS